MHEKQASSERRAALLQAAAKVSRQVISILDPDQLLERVVDIICDEFGFYYAGVFLLDEAGEWAVLRTGRGEAGAAMVSAGHKLRVGGISMIGTATGQRRALIALDVGEEPVHFKNPYLPLTRSEMALPLAVGERVIGALTVQSIEEAAFTEDDITSLQSMADQLAVALENARLYAQNRFVLRQAERRYHLLDAASKVGKRVTSILDLDRLLKETVDIICDEYGFYYAGVFLLDETKEWAVLRTGRGDAGARMVTAGHKLKVGGISMIGTATGQRRALIALDVGEEPVHFKNPYLPLTRSEMALPLAVGEKVIGALTVQSMEESAFTEDDITSLQSMADQLAVALSNAQLLRDLEAAHAELVRTKTFEALATATLEAIHWIGNKALPISASVNRLREDLNDLQGVDADLLESVREDLTLIEDSARLIVAVQEHLIGPAREQEPHPVMVEDVIKDVAVSMKIPAATISYQVAPETPLAVVDTTQLSRVLGYVLKNAVEAVEGVENPHIWVELAPTEDRHYMLVRIADSGTGIPEAEMGKIWAAFYSTKGASKHAGLGLSACVQILKQMDGKISAFNRPEGGAVFEILLQAAAPVTAMPYRPVGKSVLLIDDADSWSTFVEKTLIRGGDRVQRATNGDVDPKGFDLILIDDVLESGGSVAVLKKLKAAGVNSKTLVVASSLRVERTMELVGFGVRDVALKPYTVEGLVKLLS